MPFNYETNIGSVKQVLIDHNTITASPDLSSGLTTRGRTISLSDPEVTSIANLDLPAVFVRLSNKDEEYASLGNTGPTGNKKEANVNYEIFGYYRRQGLATQHKDLLNEIYNLAENIEGVFQAESRLSNTALWCNPNSTDFAPGEPGGEGTYIKMVKINLSAKYLFR